MPILTPETWLFIGLIFIGMLWGHVRFTAKSANDIPGILITIGIFATFYGIASGLYRFDLQNVEASLPQLIVGIKLAFWASVAGVGAALTIKIRYAVWGVKEDSEATEGATIDDLVVHLKSSSLSLERLQQAMVGDEDSTLLTQLKLIRSDQNDKLDSLRKSFDDFAKKQAENNSKALIEALKEVLRDFNTKINEQFGDNFKELNAAVGKINDWQESYRQQMTEMIEQQKQTAKDMAASSSAFSRVVENSQSFSAVADALNSTIGTFAAVEKALRTDLLALGQLIASAKDGIPLIEKKVMEIVAQVGNGAQESARVISAAVGKSTEDIGGAIKKHNETIGQNIQAAHNHNQQSIVTLANGLSDNLKKHNETIGRNLTELSTKTQQQVLALDAELAQALKKSLESLGQQLGALSSKFVADYGPLTERLREIVQLARQVRP